ncbi:hypothetical protein MJH12_08085 [bacterium]|nr:hypothetical protein [bacterium]
MNLLLASLYPFCPEILYPESIIFGALQDTEHKLYMLRSGPNPKIMPGLSMIGLGALDRCPPALLENILMFEEDLLKKLPNVEVLIIDDFINEEELYEIKTWIDQIEIDPRLDNSHQIQFLGIDVGKHATFNTLRQFKLDRTDNLSEDVLERYQTNLSACAVSVVIAKNVSQVVNFDRVSLSHYNYCTSKSFFHTLEKLSSTKLFATTTPNIMGMGISHSLVGWCQKKFWTDKLFDHWDRIKEDPRKDLEKASKHYQNLFLGNSRADYSSAVSKNNTNIYETWGFSKDKKIVMIAMSSADEMFAVTKSGEELGMKILFDNQLDWLSKLVPILKTHHEYQFVIRIHPRDMYNGIASEHLNEIIEICGDLPCHMVLNVPKDEISSHEIMKYCSLLLTSWSTTSIEMGLFGIPTLSITKYHDTLPQSEMGHQAHSIEEYFEILESLLQVKNLFDFQFIRYAFRWSYFYYNLVHLDLSDSLNYKKNKLSQEEDSRLRDVCREKFEQTKLPLNKYNPMYINFEYPIQETGAIKASLLNDIEAYEYKLQNIETASANSEKGEIEKVLRSLLSIMFAFPEDRKIIYLKTLPDKISEKNFYLIDINSSKENKEAPQNIRYIENHEVLLKNLSKICFGANCEKL